MFWIKGHFAVMVPTAAPPAFRADTLLHSIDVQNEQALTVPLPQCVVERGEESPRPPRILLIQPAADRRSRRTEGVLMDGCAATVDQTTPADLEVIQRLA